MVAGKNLIKALIMGPPGSGKGTIAKRIIKDFGMRHIASGDVLRRQMALKTEVGLVAEKYIKTGDLVPDEVMTKLILSALENDEFNDSSWLLDGFPRTLDQCDRLHDAHKLDVVVNLDVPFDEIINRVKDRWIHEPSGRIYNLVFNPPRTAGLDDDTCEPLIQRNDDKEETVRERLKKYQEKTEPLLDYYKKKKLLLNFQGRFSNEIWPRVHKELSRFVQPLQYTEYK